MLVVGVDDKKASAAAFRGTSLDPVWLQQRIFELSQQQLSVPEIEIIQDASTAGQRIYLIDVPFNLAEVRIDGKLYGRKGTKCVELTGDDARRLLEHRRRYDWSAVGSGLRLSAIHRSALDVAHRMYRERQGLVVSDLELVRRLGALRDDTADPELNRAGALLLCEYEPDLVQLELIHARTEGTPSLARLSLNAPMTLALDMAWKFLSDLFRARSDVPGLVRREVRSIAEPALREIIVNAVAHRDYDSPGSIIATVIGEPAVALKIDSPGSLPPGVELERLIAAASTPRNRALFHAMRTLGLGENEGVGIDKVYRLMLQDGHAFPEFRATPRGLICRLDGGPVDPIVRAFFDQLGKRDPQLEEDTRVAIAVTQLLERRYLEASVLAASAQCSEPEAAATLAALVRADVCEPTPKYPRQHRLTTAARHALAPRLGYPSLLPKEDRWQRIRAYLLERGDIGNSELQELLTIPRVTASRLLGEFTRSGRLTRRRLGRYPRYQLSVATRRRHR